MFLRLLGDFVSASAGRFRVSHPNYLFQSSHHLFRYGVSFVPYVPIYLFLISPVLRPDIGLSLLWVPSPPTTVPPATAPKKFHLGGLKHHLTSSLQASDRLASAYSIHSKVRCSDSIGIKTCSFR